jgi:hypothetical protein
MLNGREFFYLGHLSSFFYFSFSLSFSLFFFLVELPSLFWDILIRGSKKEYLELFLASKG